jgi:protease-4
MAVRFTCRPPSIYEGSMKNRPFLMALSTLGAIFLLFFVLVLLLSRCSGRFEGLPVGDKVGVIEVSGVLTVSEPIVKQLNAFKRDDSIKAVVLRVNSPGGGVAPSQEVYDEVARVAARKPVVVSMASVAASGGYYISLPAHRILANPGSITGSIGVLMEFTNFEELFKKVGLKNQVVKSGAHKDIGSPLRPMTAADRAILQGMIDDVYDQFVSAVSQGRKMDAVQVRKLADGRIFSGRQAQKAGLVDELGGLQDGIRVAAEMAGIEGEPRVVYPPEKKENFLQYLIEETATRVGRCLEQRYGASGLQYRWASHD